MSALTSRATFKAADRIASALLEADERPRAWRKYQRSWVGYRFLNPTNPANGNVLEFEMTPGRFRLLDTGKTLKINTIAVLARCTDDAAYQVVATPPLPPPPPAGSNTMSIAKLNQFGGLHFAQRDVSMQGIEVTPNGPHATWRLRVNRPAEGICRSIRRLRRWKWRIYC
jgi:hypothetical protein